MKKCKYCYFQYDGEIPRDRKDIFKIKIGSFGKDPLYLAASLCASKANNVLFLSVFNNGTAIDDGKFFTKINYCPMCGRKLCDK